MAERMPIQGDVTIYDGYLDLKSHAEAAEAELAAARAENERLRAGVEAALVVIDGHDRHQHLFARKIRRALLDGASS